LVPESASTPTPDGAAPARGWLENSPFVSHLGIRLESMESDRARLTMPFSDALPTMGDVVHGGAPARGSGVSADARVTRRGKDLCFCEVSVTDEAGTQVANGLVSYRL
jgi:acyl-coenzyme A thioesterase PaaI-like protein